eukprot:scaffold250597_cov32-Prasinocladus_malaysianus.AAC.1
MVRAAEHGYMDVLRWAIANGRPFKHDVYVALAAACRRPSEYAQMAERETYNDPFWADTCSETACIGGLEMLQGLSQGGCA